LMVGRTDVAAAEQRPRKQHAAPDEGPRPVRGSATPKLSPYSQLSEYV
jgi:hypothetical protein